MLQFLCAKIYNMRENNMTRKDKAPLPKISETMNKDTRSEIEALMGTGKVKSFVAALEAQRAEQKTLPKEKGPK